LRLLCSKDLTWQKVPAERPKIGPCPEKDSTA